MNFNQNGGNWLEQIPPVTRNLIIINILIWVVEFAAPGFGRKIVSYGGLHYVESSIFNRLQPFTYMFIHDPRNIMHVAFNMFTLWMFGRVLEQVWGSKRYLFFYLVCGIGAAFIQECVWALTWEHDYISDIAKQNGFTYTHMQDIVAEARISGDTQIFEAMAQYKSFLVTVGASGAIFGLLLGFAFVFPDLPMYIMFIPVPVKAKYMVAGYAVIEFFLGVGGRVDTVAHFAHLGGMIFGLLILLYWKKKGTLHGNRYY